MHVVLAWATRSVIQLPQDRGHGPPLPSARLLPTCVLSRQVHFPGLLSLFLKSCSQTLPGNTWTQHQREPGQPMRVPLAEACGHISL